MGTSMFVKVSGLKGVRFDEDFFCYVEETDFCNEINKIGGKCVSVTNSFEQTRKFGVSMEEASQTAQSLRNNFTDFTMISKDQREKLTNLKKNEVISGIATLKSQTKTVVFTPAPKPKKKNK